jgi:hypothetical protein
MNHNTLGRFGGWALLVLAATQGLLLGLRQWPGSVASDPWLAAGDRLPYQEVRDALGWGVWAPSPAPSRHPSVLSGLSLGPGRRPAIRHPGRLGGQRGQGPWGRGAIPFAPPNTTY